MCTAPLNVQPHKLGTNNLTPLQNESKNGYGPKMESNSAPHGRGRRAAQPQSMMLDTSAQAVEQPPMEPRDALEHRRQMPQTPYMVEAWK